MLGGIEAFVTNETTAENFDCRGSCRVGGGRWVRREGLEGKVGYELRVGGGGLRGLRSLIKWSNIDLQQKFTLTMGREGRLGLRPAERTSYRARAEQMMSY